MVDEINSETTKLIVVSLKTLIFKFNVLIKLNVCYVYIYICVCIPRNVRRTHSSFPNDRYRYECNESTINYTVPLLCLTNVFG